jgi:hypothetical protein
MSLRSLLVVLGVVAGLTVGAGRAHAGKGVKKNQGEERHTHGVVVSVDHEKGGHGHIVVKVHHHKKKKGQTVAQGSKAHEHKFSVGKGTRFEVVSGKEHHAVHFDAVKKGEHVVIAHKAGSQHAADVVIHRHGGKKATTAKK